MKPKINKKENKNMSKHRVKIEMKVNIVRTSGNCVQYSAYVWSIYLRKK